MKANIVRKITNDLYVVSYNGKERLYNKSTGLFVGDLHDHIYPTNYYAEEVLQNQDYIKTKNGTYLITSIMNYQGKYLGGIYSSVENKYYDPERLDFDYKKMLLKIRKSACGIK